VNLFGKDSLIHRYIAIIAVQLCLMMTVLDGAIVNVALPVIAKQFHISSALSVWIVNAYQLVIVMTILVFASLGDTHGYRRIFLIGTVVFTLSSAMCAMSTSFEMLIVARILQGVGAGCVMSVNPALVRLIYPPSVLGRGLALNAMVIAVSSAAGPSLAGAILAISSWHWMFIINVPIGALALFMGLRHLPQNNVTLPKTHFDYISAACNILFFGIMIYSVGSFSVTSDLRLSILEVIAFVLIGVYYVKRQRNLSHPILPVDLLKIPIFTLSICTSITSFAAQMLAMVSVPFLFHDQFGYNEVQTGLLITPWPLMIFVAAPLAGRLVEKVNPGILGSVGMTFLTIGLIALALLPEHPTMLDIMWRMGICGFGFGLFQTPNNVMIISSTPKERSGGASGMLGTARLTGQAVGTALVSLLLHIHGNDRGTYICLIIGAVFAVLAALISGIRTVK
jgi:DHA2 family multidrug resistance protein-like MFS transporter